MGVRPSALGLVVAEDVSFVTRAVFGLMMHYEFVAGEDRVT